MTIKKYKVLIDNTVDEVLTKNKKLKDKISQKKVEKDGVKYNQKSKLFIYNIYKQLIA